ncbi:MAG: aldo/keto reductase [Prevotellaceae bacterium]|nr:aldo/keto reductase [Prevotellaceae bacterium]
MIYTNFKGKELSMLGFGLMRLPEKDGQIDAAQVETMIEAAIKGGVNYFDTAWPYHNGTSETVVGEILKKYPRESFYLADKYPGHQHFKEFHPEEIFEKQLKKCQVDYFDFYLMHNMCENSLADYMDKRWGMLEYFVQQKREGRIHHLGMSTHASAETLRAILDSEWGKEIEFCQIQLNYVDWTLQQAKEKVEILREHNIPIWVMEGLRGGLLANPPIDAFRWLQSIDGVTVVLSGMSNLQQVIDNISIFNERKPLSQDEFESLSTNCNLLNNVLPCTACRYCTSECPIGLDIPTLIASYNDIKVTPEGQVAFTPIMYIETLDESKQPKSCLACGACASVCPQGIDIPQAMSDLAESYDGAKKWSDICEERNRLNP